MDETLVLLAKEIRRKTLKLIDGVSEEDARWAPEGTSNHLLWHAGHAYVLGETLGLAAIEGRPGKYPHEWFESFSWKSLPRAVQKWPTLAEVREALQKQDAELVAAIEKLAPEQLGKNIGSAEKPRTLRYSILHGLHDEANHQGEMYLLRKLISCSK
jgi:hypothetical protein